VVAWFAERYPLVRGSTVRAHVVGLTENDNTRHHYASLAKRTPLFVREPDGTLLPYDPEERVEPDVEQEDSSLEFVLETYLEAFLLDNWDGIEWGRPLELWESESGAPGTQLATPIGRLDFLCRDTDTDALVVVELKRGKPSDRVVGQAARYMGWVRQHIARPDQRVEGIIVAHEQELQLAYAVSAVSDLSVLTYRIDFALSSPAPVDAH
jgi:restriction system protein